MNLNELTQDIHVVSDRSQKLYVLDLTHPHPSPYKIRIWDTETHFFIVEDSVWADRMELVNNPETLRIFRKLYGQQPDKDYHGSSPNNGVDRPVRSFSSVKSTPTTTVTPETKKMLDDMEKAPGKVVCPNCGGDGGAKGECYKCDGTGWTNN